MLAHLCKSQENLDRKRKTNSLLVREISSGCMDIRTSLMLFPASPQQHSAQIMMSCIKILKIICNCHLRYVQGHLFWPHHFIFFLIHEYVRIFCIFITVMLGAKKNLQADGLFQSLETTSFFLTGSTHKAQIFSMWLNLKT